MRSSSALVCDREGRGTVKLTPEEADDLWHLYELVCQGDRIRSFTKRKIKTESASGNVNVDVKKMVLTIEVEKSDYDGQGIRFSGKNMTEHPDMKIGAYHTIEVTLNQSVDLEKSNWDFLMKKRLLEATNSHKSADTAAVLIEPGKACLYLLTASLVKELVTVTGTAKSKKPSGKGKGENKFYDSVMSSISNKFDLKGLKCMIVGGAPEVVNEFVDYIISFGQAKGCSDLCNVKQKFAKVSCTGVHMSALAEALLDPEVAKKVGDVRAVTEVNTVNTIHKLVGDPESTKVCYGIGPVAFAIEYGAVDTLCIIDEILKNVEGKKRKFWAKLAETVNDSGGSVVVVTKSGPAGNSLGSLGGVAATLRFPVYELKELAPDYLPDGLKEEKPSQ